MAKNTNVDLTADTWTLLSESGVSVSIVTVQNLGPSDIRIMATATEVAPTDPDDGLIMDVQDVALGLELSSLFPGVAGVRLYGKSLTGTARVFVSHA